MNIKYTTLLFIAVIISLASCKNNDEVFKTVVNSSITVVNASADTLNFYLNGTRQNNTSSIFPGGSVAGLIVPAGAQNYQFKKAGSAVVLFSLPLNLSNGTNNSLYVTGEQVGNAFNTTDVLQPDSIPFATVRFVNAAPDAGNLDIFVGDTVNFTNTAFKASSAFLPVGSGQKHIRILQTGTTIAKIDTIIALQPARVYTLFAKGLLNGKGNAVFDVGVVLNL